MASLQFRFYQQSYRFRFKMGFFLPCLFFIILFSTLGNWQLHRYHYKKTLLAIYQRQMEIPAQSFLKLKDFNHIQFQRVTVEGVYLDALTMLVQNKIHQGQVGFEVLTPLQVTGQKKLLLIDRGWVQKPADQNIPPLFSNGTRHDFEDDRGNQPVVGYIKLLNEYQFILGKNILNISRYISKRELNTLPIVMQKIDLDEISQITHQSFYPFILRLDASQPHGFSRDWDITTVLPERHMGYAIQWFVLAIIVLIGYLFFCCEKNDAK